MLVYRPLKRNPNQPQPKLHQLLRPPLQLLIKKQKAKLFYSQKNPLHAGFLLPN
jgi:hypothetical protein